MNRVMIGMYSRLRQQLSRGNEGMELIQVAILIAIAVAVGLIFKTRITNFVNEIFGNLNASQF